VGENAPSTTTLIAAVGATTTAVGATTTAVNNGNTVVAAQTAALVSATLTGSATVEGAVNRVSTQVSRDDWIAAKTSQIITIFNNNTAPLTAQL
jgi:hypothetical protein